MAAKVEHDCYGHGAERGIEEERDYACGRPGFELVDSGLDRLTYGPFYKDTKVLENRCAPKSEFKKYISVLI